MFADDLHHRSPSMDRAMIDLHGCSEETAKRQVLYWVRELSGRDCEKVRFVTGRGKHVNAKGERGTLYKNFENWLKAAEYGDRISSVKRKLGFFDVIFKEKRQVTACAKETDDSVKLFFLEQKEKIKVRAEEGDPCSRYLYAYFLEEGLYFTENRKKAFEYYTLSAEDDHLLAIYDVGRCYLHGIGVQQSDAHAFSWFSKAESMGMTLAVLAVGDCYAKGLGVQKDSKVAVSYYAKAAAKKNAVAMRKLGSAYHIGDGVEPDEKKSFSWYKQSADLGDPISQYNIASRFDQEENFESAFKYFSLAAENGEPDAQWMLGYKFYLSGLVVEKDEKIGLEWIKKAADNGSIQANSFLGQDDQLESQDIYLRRSAQAGNFIDEIKLLIKSGHYSKDDTKTLMNTKIREAFRLGISEILQLPFVPRFYLIDGLLADKKLRNRRKAYSAILEMAEQKCIFSLRRLFYIYRDGLVGKKNIPEGIKALNKAISLDDGKSMCILAAYYHSGTYVDESYDEAFKLYQRAADHDNPPACYYMGFVYAEAIRVDRDLERAKKYYERSIELEQSTKIMNFLETGTLDSYRPISDLARRQILQLEEASVTTSQVQNRQEIEPEAKSKTSAFTKGFFANVSRDLDSPTQKLLKKYHINERSQPALEKGLRNASAHGAIDDLKCFITLVDNISAQDTNPRSRRTALHWAVIKKHVACVEKLLEKGANIQIEDAEEKTAFDYAKEQNETTILDLFPSQRWCVIA